MAFAPDFATSGRLYVFYTGTDGGDLHVDELTRERRHGRRRRRCAPVITDPAPAARPTTTAASSSSGPTATSTSSTGDGGGGGDPGENAQDLDSLLGKLLRIDPRTPGGGVLGARRQPLRRRRPGADEIWSYGLRNPWRFSFDRLTGDLTDRRRRPGRVGGGRLRARAPRRRARRQLRLGLPRGPPRLRADGLLAARRDHAAGPRVPQPTAAPHRVGGHRRLRRPRPRRLTSSTAATSTPTLCAGVIRSLVPGVPDATDDRSEGLSRSGHDVIRRGRVRPGLRRRLAGRSPDRRRARDRLQRCPVRRRRRPTAPRSPGAPATTRCARTGSSGSAGSRRDGRLAEEAAVDSARGGVGDGRSGGDEGGRRRVRRSTGSAPAATDASSSSSSAGEARAVRAADSPRQAARGRDRGLGDRRCRQPSPPPRPRSGSWPVAARRTAPVPRLRAMTVVVKLGSSIVADDGGELRTRRARRRLRAGRRAARRRRERRDGHLGRDRARDAADGAGRAPEGDRRAAGRVGGRPGVALSRLRGAARRARRARRAGAADRVRHRRPDPLRRTRARRCAGCSSGASSRSSTRTTRRRPTRSRSATTTSSRPRSRSCSRRGCWCC